MRYGLVIGEASRRSSMSVWRLERVFEGGAEFRHVEHRRRPLYWSMSWEDLFGRVCSGQFRVLEP